MFYFFQHLLFNLRAQTAHGLHSPLVYDLYTQVINPNLGSFSTKKMLEKLQIYIKSKIEIKDFNLLIINTLDDFNNIEITINQLIYIDQPYRNLEFLKLTNQLAEEKQINYVIHFFFGTLLIASNLAPKQVFYLKEMK